MKKCLQVLCAAFMIMSAPGCFTDSSESVTQDQNSGPLVSGIEISQGSLDPGFSPDVTQYTVNVPGGTESVYVTVISETEGISISVNGSPVEPGQLSDAVAIGPGGSMITVCAGLPDSSITYSIQVNRDEVNLVANPSFESLAGESPCSWTVITSGDFMSGENPAPYNGERSAYFTDLTSAISGREVRSDSFSVDHGMPLAVSARFRTELDPGRTRVSLKVWFYSDAEGTSETGSLTGTAVHLASAGNWEELRRDCAAADIPEGTVSARVSIRIMYDSTGGGTGDDRVYVDNVVIQVPENSVLNHSFETLCGAAPENWDMISSGSCVALELADAPDGERVFSFDRLTSSIAGREAASAPFTVRPGVRISLHARIRASRGNGVCRAAFRIYYFQDEEGAVPSALNEYDTMNSVPVGSDTEWEILSWDRDGENVPSDAAFARIAMRACYDSSSGGNGEDMVFFDDVTVTQP